MIIRRNPLQRLVPYIGYAFAFAATGYFTWSAWHGERGIMARMHYEQQIDERQKTIADLKSDRHAWENRVAMLQSEHIDKDLLEERARIVMNAAHPNDVIVQFDGKTQALKTAPASTN